MKKLLMLTLALALSCSLFSCGDSKSEDDKTEKTKVEENETEATDEETETEAETEEPKSEEAKACEELIEAIGTVSLDSEEAIKAAEDAYEALSDDDKESVKDSAEKLQNDRTTYDGLVAQAKADEVVALADAIGEVTVDSEAAIKAAEDAYAALTDEEKALIPDCAKKIEDARAAYDAAVLKAKVDPVVAAIKNIGTVSKDSGAAIRAARELYDELSYEEKKLVSNYSVLESAESAYKDSMKEIVDTYLPRFKLDEDKVTGLSWIMHTSMPDYIDTRSYIIPYIGLNSSSSWLCIRFNYTGNSWIFWENLTIVADGEKFYEFVSYFDVTRDNDGDVWEYYDLCLPYNAGMDNADIEMLQAIANSSETIIRFQGDNYYYDLTVTETDKQMIRDTLALYEAFISLGTTSKNLSAN